MNRTDRLVGIMLVLQSRRTTSASELAQRFAVTRRTVYRDLKALAEADFPLGGAGGRYAVAEGHQLTAVAFPTPEAVTLILGARLLHAISEPSLKATIDAATARLEAALPAPVLQRSRELLASVRMQPGVSMTGRRPTELLGLLRAVATQRAARIVYVSAGTGEVTERTIEPVGVLVGSTHWSVVAHCRLRADTRVFRGDRIERVAFLDEWFVSHPSVLEALTSASASPDEGATMVRLKASLAMAQRLRGELGTRLLAEEADGDCVRLTARLPGLDRAIPLLLALGAEIEVLEPRALREAIACEAELLHAVYASRWTGQTLTISDTSSA